MNRPIDRNDIEKVFQDIASELYSNTDPIQVVTSHNKKHGRFNANCQDIANQLGLNAVEVGQSIVDLANMTELAKECRFNVVEPGFIQIREVVNHHPMSPRMRMLMAATRMVASDDYL